MSRILVVEDEKHIQRLIRIVLERGGHKVQTASSGEEALAVLEHEPLPHLVLLDIMMSGINGLQVLQKIKSDVRTKEVQVVLLSALAQETIVTQGIKMGARDYIRKPFHPQALVSRLATFL